MNKGDLVEEVAKVVSTKKQAQAAVDCVFSVITKALKRKDPVTLVGFGTFKLGQRKARIGRNPQTGAKIQIKARRVPVFVPGTSLKAAVGRGHGGHMLMGFGTPGPHRPEPIPPNQNNDNNGNDNNGKGGDAE